MREPTSPDWENLTTEQYYDIATGHDIAAWQAQQEAFAAMRDLCDDVAAECRAELDRLKETWSGQAVHAFEARFEQVLSAVDSLRDSAASNSDGMREMTAAMRELASEARLLRVEDQEWQRNPAGDDRDMVRRLRDGLRGELRAKVIESDERFQQLSASYLLSPPTVPDTDLSVEPKSPGAGSPAPDSAPRAAEEPPGARSADTASLQSGPQAASPPVEPAPQPQQAPPPVDAPTPMMPMGGEAGAGGGGSSGGSRRSAGPVFDEAKQRPGSRMRSVTSRQELLNQSRYGEYQRPDPQRQRRVAGAEEDSPFASDATVVPPVVSGGALPVGPHDSGPAVTGTVYRYFPEYWQQERPRQFDEAFGDGSRAQVNVPIPDKSAVSRLTTGDQESTRAEQSAPEPRAQRSDTAGAQEGSQTIDHLPSGQAAFTTGQPRSGDQTESVNAPAPRTHDDARTRSATDSRETLGEQRRRRREAREQRRQTMRDDDEE